MLLYIHVPFCRQKCRYCAFHSHSLARDIVTHHQDTTTFAMPSKDYQQHPVGEHVTLPPCDRQKKHLMAEHVTRDNRNTSERISLTQKEFLHHEPYSIASSKIQDTLTRYSTLLLQEMSLRSARLPSPNITSIFFGGGTPSLLDTHQIEAILNAAARHFTFAEHIEITLEANPESLGTVERIRDLQSCGINRLSLGVQSLDDTLLRYLGRPHSASEAISAFTRARQAGFENINLDLMWGLPNQTTVQWLSQLQDIIALQPEHLSCYSLTIEEGTPLAEDMERGALHLPDDKTQEEMFIKGHSLLEASHYMHYEIANFAREGYQCQHNLGYWRGEDYLGLGPAAVSTIANMRHSNSTKHSEWEQGVITKKPSGTKEHLSPKTKVLENIMLSLRTKEGLSLDRLQEQTGITILEEYHFFIQSLCQQHLAQCHNNTLTLTPQGMLLSNLIIERFFAFFS